MESANGVTKSSVTKTLWKLTISNPRRTGVRMFIQTDNFYTVIVMIPKPETIWGKLKKQS
jgi:hypothetical protein